MHLDSTCNVQTALLYYEFLNDAVFRVPTHFSSGVPFTKTHGWFDCMCWLPSREMAKMLRMPSLNLEWGSWEKKIKLSCHSTATQLAFWKQAVNCLYMASEEHTTPVFLSRPAQSKWYSTTSYKSNKNKTFI